MRSLAPNSLRRRNLAWVLAWLACACAPSPAHTANLPQTAAAIAPTGFDNVQRTDPESKQRLGFAVMAGTPTEAASAPTAAAAHANAGQSSSQTLMGPNQRLIKLPDRIPAQCVKAAAERYQVPEMAMLAILRQESGGRTGVVGKNTDGSLDYGPAQFNSNSWARYMRERYGISTAQLTNDMCQALMAQAYALRWEWNRCIKQRRQTSIWCAVAFYHSRTKEKQRIYIQNVWRQHQRIIGTGKF